MPTGPNITDQPWESTYSSTSADVTISTPESYEPPDGWAMYRNFAIDAAFGDQFEGYDNQELKGCAYKVSVTIKANQDDAAPAPCDIAFYQGSNPINVWWVGGEVTNLNLGSAPKVTGETITILIGVVAEDPTDLSAVLRDDAADAVVRFSAQG